MTLADRRRALRLTQADVARGLGIPRRSLSAVELGPEEAPCAVRYAALLDHLETLRQDVPRTRGDCADGARPCPHLRCRWHLWAEWPAATETCTLDLADREGLGLRDIAEAVGVTHQAVSLLEISALRALRDVTSAQSRESSPEPWQHGGDVTP